MKGDVPNDPLVGRRARLIAGGEWADARLDEMSPRAARFEIDWKIDVGAPVVACIAEVGALAGVVETVEAGACMVAFTSPRTPGRSPTGGRTEGGQAGSRRLPPAA